MDNLIGRKLDGRYEILEQIGSGGMANVYKARDVAENTTVAVKVLKDEFVNNEEFLRRFKNESKAIAMLSHPNIVKVYDVNFSDATQYIVMEYIDGVNFKTYLDRQKKLGWKDAIYFTEQVLRALQHAHDRGIIHRDIKPQNIMLLRDGTIKVMDFGIARFSRSQTRTITDKAIGSVHYISPEQAKGAETDAKSDIYSLGVMLYEMLTGKLPFESDSPVSVAIKQISDDPPKLRDTDPSIPEALEEITLKAMAKEPSERYQSAAAMLKDIEEFKNNPSIRFEYKYMNTEKTESKVKEVIDSEKSLPKGKWSTPPSRRTLPILIGITCACIVGALLLIFLTFGTGENSIFNNHKDVDLPNFVGMVYDTDIKDNKDYKDFTINVVEDYNEEYEVGYVFDQDPLPPRTVKDNSTITIYVSKGIEYVTVPDTFNMSYDEAFAALTDNKLVIMTETVDTTEVSENHVLKSNPAAGETVEAWTVVTLYVRAQTVDTSRYVPKVTGLSVLDATTTLTTNGLVRGNVTEEYSSEYASGLVIKQSIDEGQLVAQGTAVDLVVSKGNENAKPTSLTITIKGNGGYGISTVVAGQTYTTNSITVSGPASEAVNITVTVKNGDQSKSGSYSTTYGAGHYDIDVSGLIPSDWTPTSYSITTSAGSGGSITSSKTVSAGESVTITVKPDSGYEVDSVTVDGSSASLSNGTYTFNNVQGNHSISVTFKQSVINP